MTPQLHHLKVQRTGAVPKGHWRLLPVILFGFGRGPIDLLNIFGRVFLEVFHTILAAKLDFAALVDVHVTNTQRLYPAILRWAGGEVRSVTLIRGGTRVWTLAKARTASCS
jgi:hypothetical protein